MHEARDASNEIEEVLKYLIYYGNGAPCSASRLMIQRFRVSNPSRKYIEKVATAFKNGMYAIRGVSFGDGSYGNLGSTAAATILDREARSVILDADPTGGSLREVTLNSFCWSLSVRKSSHLSEPIICNTRTAHSQTFGFMRAMEYSQKDESPELRLSDLQLMIGLDPREIPIVFSYFLSTYAAHGHIKAASLTSPKAQVLSCPKIVRFINGELIFL